MAVTYWVKRRRDGWKGVVVVDGDLATHYPNWPTSMDTGNRLLSNGCLNDECPTWEAFGEQWWSPLDPDTVPSFIDIGL